MFYWSGGVMSAYTANGYQRTKVVTLAQSYVQVVYKWVFRTTHVVQLRISTVLACYILIYVQFMQWHSISL